jgi:glycolate oxidase FAD binding subunit
MPAGGFEPIVGPAHVRESGGETLDGVPVEATVRPGTAGEVAACLGRAREQGLALVPSGGGTKLGWANPLDARRVVRLDLRRLRDLSLDPDEGIATVGAGAELGVLARAAAESGKRVLVDGPQEGATLGGTLASDPPAARASPPRATSYEVLGATVALTNGTLARAGGKVVKNVTGFDLVRLYVGSFGTLCVMTELVLRLRPRPERRQVMVLEGGSLADLLAVAQEVRLSGAGPEGLAVLPRRAPPRLVYLLEGAEADVERRARCGPGEPGAETDWEEARRVLAEPGPAPCRLRVAARPSDTLAVADAVAGAGGEDARSLLLPLAGVALADVDAAGAPRLFEEAASNEWTLRLERAPLDLRRRLDAFGPPPATLPLMRALKQRFDPDRILSPGRFVGRL